MTRALSASILCADCGRVGFRSIVYVSRRGDRPLQCLDCAEIARLDKEAARAVGRYQRRKAGRAPACERKGSSCRECEGMPWRRDVPYCSGCGEAHSAEPPVTLADVMAMPVENRRMA